MKKITIIMCGFSLAIALVALPFQYMEHITSGLGLSLAGRCFWPGLAFFKEKAHKRLISMM